MLLLISGAVVRSDASVILIDLIAIWSRYCHGIGQLPPGVFRAGDRLGLR